MSEQGKKRGPIAPADRATRSPFDRSRINQSMPDIGEHSNTTEQRAPDTTPGAVTWHLSDEDCGPDVGISIGLGDGCMLWIGEISKDRWEEAGGTDMDLGDDFGKWIVLYEPEPIVIGRCPSDLDISHVADLIAMRIRR